MVERELVFWLLACITVTGATLAYTYVVFPLAMAILGRRQPPLLARLEQEPFVSLIIPTYNEAELIEEKIQNSLDIDYPNLEIVVADDGSTDGTVEIVRRFKQVRLLKFTNRRGKTSVVADAVAASQGAILCLCDANVMFRPDALWRLVTRLSGQNVAGVTGDVRLQSEKSNFGQGEALYYRLERSIHRGESCLGAVIGVDGGMYVMRRELFCQLPADTVLDDFTLSMQMLRSGEKLLYEQTAIANENSTELAMEEYRRRVRMGVGVTQVLCRGWTPHWWQPGRWFLFVSHKLLRWMSPWLLLGLLVAAIALSFCHCFAWVILGPGLVFAGLALAGALFPRLRRLWMVAVPFYFVLSQLALAWGMVSGLLFDSTGVWSRTTRTPLADEPGLK